MEGRHETFENCEMSLSVYKEFGDPSEKTEKTCPGTVPFEGGSLNSPFVMPAR